MKTLKGRDLACVIGIALVLLDGCRLSYRLQGQAGTAILLPPVAPTTLTGVPSVLLIRVSNARSRRAILDGCDIDNDLLGLQWLGPAAEIRLKSESYFPAPGDERPEESAPRVYLDTVHRVEAFRDALEDRVVRGCLRSDEAQVLIRAIVERLPLPPLIGHFIRFGGGATVDLTADFRLKVVSPVRSGESAQEVVGYQIAYYRLAPAPKDARVKISLSSISTGGARAAQKGESSSAGPLVFPASFMFFRLLFRTANSPADHLATILSADDEAPLDKATSRFEIEGDASCAVLSMPGVTCLTPASEVSINLEFPVSVNGNQVFVTLGATVSSAMQSTKGAIGIPAALRIRRRFRGHLRTIKFNPRIRTCDDFCSCQGTKLPGNDEARCIRFPMRIRRVPLTRTSPSSSEKFDNRPRRGPAVQRLRNSLRPFGLLGGGIYWRKSGKTAQAATP